MPAGLGDCFVRGNGSTRETEEALPSVRFAGTETNPVADRILSRPVYLLVFVSADHDGIFVEPSIRREYVVCVRRLWTSFYRSPGQIVPS